MQYRGFTLDRFQREAIEAIQRGKDVLVCAPTGTGKTVVADYIVEATLGEGKEVIYTAPIKALSNQKFRDYTGMFEEQQVGLVTGDLVIRRDAPCRVMTTEILRNMLLSGEDLPHLAAVVIDEVHFLDDEDRGTTWEEVLIYLPQHVQIVGLSATLSNLQEFADWLGEVRGAEVVVVEEYKRAVPLSFAVATKQEGLLSTGEMSQVFKRFAKDNAHAMNKALVKSQRRSKRGRGDRGGRGRGRDAPKLASPTRHTDVFWMLFPGYAPYLYFVFSRRDAEGLARQLVQRLPRSLLGPERIERVKQKLTDFMAQTGAENALDDELANLYLSGVAFHHAGLHVMLKALVEELYEEKLIGVLYCTSTFALGINMPARAAVFDSMRRYNGKELIPLPAREFMQMAGRAGRRGLDDEGLVVIRTDLDRWGDIEDQVARYLEGVTEPVHSRFSLSFHSVAALLHRHSTERIREIVELSFLAFRRRGEAERHERNAIALADSLEEQGWSEGQWVSGRMKKEVRRLEKLQQRATEGTDLTWQEFEEKVLFLQLHGFVDEEGRFLAGARCLLHLQFQEIFTTELFLEGVLAELDLPTLFGVLCGMCNELPRGVVVADGRAWRGLGRRIEAVRRSPVVTESEALTRSRVTWDEGMIPLGHKWAEGKPLAEVTDQVHHTSDITGDLVGAFRRAKDLLGQVAGLFEELDPDRARDMRRLAREVSRDEVEVLD